MVKRKERSLTPQKMVEFLDQHIVGQTDAKRAVAVALRNRWRRSLVKEPLRSEIQPKNLLLIGPTGVGKTEIAKRVAQLLDAPFIKVEATKFTEVGYIGKDVESIVRDLLETSIKREREKAVNEVKGKAYQMAINRILDYLVPLPTNKESDEQYPEKLKKRRRVEEQLKAGQLDDEMIYLDLPVNFGIEVLSSPGMEEFTNQLQRIFSTMKQSKTKRKSVKISAALQLFLDEESADLINEEVIHSRAKEQVEQNGIIFLDEIDKIITNGRMHEGGEVSREGVQRDLLPLVEGTTVSTKYGFIKTDHILFIAAGAFHLTKPSDLIPELQGRFPVRVELVPLTVQDLVKILTEPKASLITQYRSLLAVEHLELKFEKSGILKIAEVAFEANEKLENIGARRLYTVMEQLLEEVSFQVGEEPTIIKIDAKYVEKRLDLLVRNEDLSRYIL